MAAKNNTANCVTGNGATGTENAGNGAAAITVVARPSGAAGEVWDALTANPGGSVAVIAEASGVSRATVARTLTSLEGDGRATRTRGGRGGGKRQPDAWHPVPAAPAEPMTPADSAGPAVDTTAVDTTAVDTTAVDTTAVDTTAVDTTAVDTTAEATDAEATDVQGRDAGMDVAVVAEARQALTAMRDALATALAALDGGDGAAALTAVEGVYSGSGKARRVVRAAVNGRPRNASGAARSAPGEMRAKVAGHLTAHPGAAFTPHEIAKVIGHSAGAVSNALDRLTEAGAAELVCERPRRFTAAAGRAAS